MGTFFQAFAAADFFGKLIFCGLFTLSCGSWVFIFQKFWMLKTVRIQAAHFKKMAKMHKEHLLNLNSHSKNPFSILYNTLKEQSLSLLDKNHYFFQGAQNYLSGRDIECLESHLHNAIAKQRGNIEKNLFILSVTKTLAPFLGLLGTVWGILVSFGDLKGGHLTGSNAAVLGGLSTALTTTILGLLIAIPALIAHSYLKNLSQTFTLEMVDFGHYLLSTVELQYRKVDVS